MFSGQRPQAMRNGLRRANYIRGARSTGRFLYSAYGIRWVSVYCIPSGDYVGAIIDRPRGRILRIRIGFRQIR